MKKKIIFLLATIVATIGLTTMVSADMDDNLTPGEIASARLVDLSTTNSWTYTEGNDEVTETIDKVVLSKGGLLKMWTEKVISRSFGTLSQRNIVYDSNGYVIRTYSSVEEKEYSYVIGLKKGTYYVKQFAKYDNNLAGMQRKYAFEACACELEGNDTKQTATPISFNTIVKGSLGSNLSFFSTEKDDAYDVFKIYVPKGYVFKVDVVNQGSIGIINILTEANGIGTVIGGLEAGKNITADKSRYYYVHIFNYGGESDIYSFKVRLLSKGTLSKPKLTKYKRNTKTIKGKAAKGSTVKITVGKKKYSVVAKKGTFSVKLKKKLKKGNKIKVYVVKSGYTKSRTVTYKVK